MCVNNIYTEVRPDGRQRTWSEIDDCKKMRAGLHCDGLQTLRHPLGYKRAESKSSRPYSHGQLPPTPPMSYHSDHTSDSERSSRRRASIYIKDNKLDVNDPRVVDVSRRRSLRHERQTSGERAPYLGSSPLRTPPQYGMPPSPVPDTHEPIHREADKRERSTSSHGHSISIEIVDARSQGHRRQGSSVKSTSSHGSIDEGRRPRRASVSQHDDLSRQRMIESEIARQNEAIANRSPVPSTPPSSRRRRGSVAIATGISASERVRHDEDKAQRQRMKEIEAKEREVEVLKLEAQRLRLKDRITIKRPNYN